MTRVRLEILSKPLSLFTGIDNLGAQIEGAGEAAAQGAAEGAQAAVQGVEAAGSEAAAGAGEAGVSSLPLRLLIVRSQSPRKGASLTWPVESVLECQHLVNIRGLQDLGTLDYIYVQQLRVRMDSCEAGLFLY